MMKHCHITSMQTKLATFTLTYSTQVSIQIPSSLKGGTRCQPHGNTNSGTMILEWNLQRRINSVTPDIGSHDILTIRMEVYPPADREAQDIGLVSLQ